MLRVVIDIEYLYEVVGSSKICFLTVPLPTPEGPERTISNPFHYPCLTTSKLFFYYLNIISYQTKECIGVLLSY